IRQSRPGRTRPAATRAEIPVDGCLATLVIAWSLHLPREKTSVSRLSDLPALPMERERFPMIRSMTGFGRQQAPWLDGSVTVELRSVNHRFLEIACRLPRQLSHLEDSFKKAIQRCCSRGRIDFTVTVQAGKGHQTLVAARTPLLDQQNFDRMKIRVEKLMGQDIPDPPRLYQELAVYADRGDITEEIVRLDSHMIQFEQTLNRADSVGKTLDFLLQEIGREVNTIGSKANDAEI